MKFNDAIDDYIRDMRSAGRIRSDRTVDLYRSVLWAHSEDVGNRDPRKTGREDCKRTLHRWPNPNTQRARRSILVSFYRWAVEEGMRKDNPAEQTRRPRAQQTDVYRLTREEVVRMMDAALPGREERAIILGFCGGFRRQELIGLQGRHFRRPGLVWVSQDIGKGGKQRWQPVIPEMRRVVDEIAASVADDEFVLCAQRWRDPGKNLVRTSLTKRPLSYQALYQLVKRVGKRAGIHEDVHPHLLRHAYGDHVARHAGLLVAQALMGHASVDTTRDTYVGQVTLDELIGAVAGFTFRYPPGSPTNSPAEATTGIEPVYREFRLPEGFSQLLETTVPLYAAHFQEAM